MKVIVLTFAQVRLTMTSLTTHASFVRRSALSVNNTTEMFAQSVMPPATIHS